MDFKDNLKDLKCDIPLEKIQTLEDFLKDIDPHKKANYT